MEYNISQHLHPQNSFTPAPLFHQQTQQSLYQQQQQRQQSISQQVSEQQFQRQQQYHVAQLQNAAAAASIYNNNHVPISQQVSHPQSSDNAFAVQPYASWASGAILNMNTNRRPRPQAIAGPPVEQHTGKNATSVQSDDFQGPFSTENIVWTQKAPSAFDVATYDSEMSDVSRPASQIERDHNIIEVGPPGDFDKDGNQNASQPFQLEIESRRPSQVSNSTYATTRLTTPDMIYPSDSDWNSAERPKSMQLAAFSSPLESPSAGSLRPGSKSRASPVQHSQMRASPYTLESNRRLRWSTGTTLPSQIPQRTPYQLNNSYSTQFGYSPLNPHNGLSSVSNEAGITTFAAPGQTLAYSQRMSAGAHFMLHHGYPGIPRQLPSQHLYSMLPSDGIHTYSGHYADLSDPPDLFASLSEKPSDPPEEDMNPSDPEMVPHEQELRFAGDLYTPKWVRGQGNKREGWCGLCKPGRWLVLKNSAYWYDKSFTHGVCAQTGAAFAAPDATRRIEGNADAWEGLCGQCGEWLSLVSSKKKGPTTWFRHVSKCHVLHKPKDIPKRRRGTIKRPPMIVSETEDAETQSGEQEDSTLEEAAVSGCGEEHDNHHHVYDLDDHAPVEQHVHVQPDHNIFTGGSRPSHLDQAVLSPIPISPKTMDHKSVMDCPNAADTESTMSAVAIPPSDRHDTLVVPPLDLTAAIKSEAYAPSHGAQQNSHSLAPSHLAATESETEIATSTQRSIPKFTPEVAKPDQDIEIQDFANAPPSPELTPISTPQLSETSFSTPQIETPLQAAQPLVGLGVQNLHMMTGMADSSHDISLEDLNHLEALYGHSSTSDQSMPDHFAHESHMTTNQANQDPQDVQDPQDPQEQIYDYSAPDEIPLPSSATVTDNMCMSSQFDTMPGYDDHQLHDLHSTAGYSNDVLGLHMDMRMLDHGVNHYSHLSGFNSFDPYNGMI